jgi:CMP-N-acetylneuraminic acid synthetase
MGKTEKDYVLGLIPARGGSKGIKNKNIRPLLNRPLITYTLDAAFKSVELDGVVISSDSDKILEVAEEYHDKTSPLMPTWFEKRPAELAQDDTPTEEVIGYTLEHFEGVTTVVLLQPTSPIRQDHEIDEAIRQYFDNGNNTIFSAVPLEGHIWKNSSINKVFTSIHDRIRRQDKHEYYYVEDGAIYIINAISFKATGKIFSVCSQIYKRDWNSGIQIDEEMDITLAEEALIGNYILEGINDEVFQEVFSERST